MKAKVDNVRIKDLMMVLARLHLDYEAVDVTVYPEEKRVTITPIGEVKGGEGEEDVENRMELGDKDFDII